MEYTLAVLRCSQPGHWNSVISKSLSIVSFYRIFDYVQQSPVASIRSLKFVKCQRCCTDAGVRMLRFFSARSEILYSVCWWTGSACSVYVINCITSERFTTWDVLTNVVSVDLIKRLLFKPDWLLTQSCNSRNWVWERWRPSFTSICSPSPFPFSLSLPCTSPMPLTSSTHYVFGGRDWLAPLDLHQ